MTIAHLTVLPSSSAVAPPPDRQRPEIEAALRGHYTILDQLGGGGMSRVYLAREHALDRIVAIKVLLPHLRDRREDRERFRREARVLGSLRHPGIVPVHALGEAGSIPYFVMPYLLGMCLGRRLAAGQRFRESEARGVLSRLADAVAAAHRCGIIHRDIKPENVLMENGRPILIDFGVATLHTSEQSRSELARAFGTPAYMAPEQLLGDTDSDARSDVYSLGVLGFELLAGRPPFVGASAREVAAQHVARAAPAVGIFRPDTSPALEQIIGRCLAKRPADRWQSAAELRDALARTGRGSHDHGPTRPWRGLLAGMRRRRSAEPGTPE